MKAFIFAAGLGTRLKPLTDTRPKALVEVNGTPLLEHVIRKLITAGVTEIVINVHHFAQQIIDFIEAKHHFGITIHISDERKMLLDTGGGIKQAHRFLKDDSTPFLIHNVDILSNVDIKKFVEEAPHDAAATLLVSNRKTNRYLLFDPQSHRLVGWTNVQTGEIKSPYPNLKVDLCVPYAFSGIHLFSPKLFSDMDKWDERFSIIDFYLSIADKQPIYARHYPDLQLLDVGKPETLVQAASFLG